MSHRLILQEVGYFYAVGKTPGFRLNETHILSSQNPYPVMMKPISQFNETHML